MDFFKIINDIAAETRMNMGEKVRMAAGSCAGKMKTAGPETTRPHDIQ